MDIVTNDMVIHNKFEDKETAIKQIRSSIQILMQLKKDGNFVRLSAARNIFQKMELAQGYYFEQLFYETNDVFDQKEKMILKTMLVNFNKIDLTEERFDFENIESLQCAWAALNDAFLFSIPTEKKWAADKLSGILRGKEEAKSVEIKNIALKSHIKTYEKQLGIRKYEFNPKHKINVGWGTEMDLDDQEAQELLMAAVPVDESYRHLVAKKNGRYYSFRCHYGNCYHGYWDNTMSEKNRNIVDRNFT